MAYQLNLRDVQLAGRKAYLEGRLQAQKNPRMDCTYRDNQGNPCVIGAAIKDTVARKWDNGVVTAIESLINNGEVKTDHPEELVFLQRIHDYWSGFNGGIGLDPHKDAKRTEALLVLVLGMEVDE